MKVLGGKTGYNDDARYCLVIATKIDGRMCYMSFLANEGKLTRFGDVARVADWMVGRNAPATARAPKMLTATAPAGAAPMTHIEEPAMAKQASPATPPGMASWVPFEETAGSATPPPPSPALAPPPLNQP